MNDGYVPTLKDSKKVKTKVAFNLTRRHFIGRIYSCRICWNTSVFIYEKVYA